VLALLGAATGNAPEPERTEALPHCYEAGWKPPCVIGLDCTPGDPFDHDSCDYALSRDCSEIERIDCGDMPNR
jgi:hypothetical protein